MNCSRGTHRQGVTHSRALQALRGGRGWRALAAAALALFLPVIPLTASGQTSLPYVVEVPQQLSQSIGGPNGNLAANQNGDVFVPDAAGSIVYEFPSNGGAPVPIFTANFGPQVSGVAVDSNNNLYVTSRYDGNVSATDSDIFEFPYSNGSYPAPYTYTGTAPAHCTATSTSVCTYGQFLQITGYYYQPQAIAFDGAGNLYMITTYDSYSGGGKTIYECSVQCGLNQASATVFADHLPTKATSLASNAAADLFYTDGLAVYEIAAGTTTPVVFDNSLAGSTSSGAQGVGFDRAGNLYVNVNEGGAPYDDGDIEYPLVNGTLSASNKILLDTQYGYTGPTVDSHGNIWTASYSSVYEFQLFNGTFPSTPVGSSSAAINFTVLFNQAGTIASLKAYEGSAAATEFVISADGCTGTSQGVRGSCTFNVTFSPSSIGVRKGAVVLTDTSGFQVTTYLTGVGTGSGVTIDPGTPVSIGTTFTTPSGVAIDNAGDVFVTDAGAKTVSEFVGGTGTPVAVGSGYTSPTGVAVDSVGNVFVADNGAGTIFEIPSVNGTLSTAAPTALVTGLKNPTDLVVDGIGELYVSVTGSNVVLQYPTLGRYMTSSAASSLGSGLSGPTGIDVDLNGNLYIADTGNNRVVEVAAGAGQSSVGSGLSAPTGVTVEPSGSVIIADQGNGRLVRVPNETAGLSTVNQLALPQPLVNPYAVRISTAGNLYVTDNQSAVLDELQRTAGTLNFGIANTNAPTAPQSIVLSSIGSTPLTLGSPLYPAVPASSDFTVTSGSGSAACSSGTLNAGYDCTLTSIFDPTSTGILSYPLTFSIAASNVTNPTLELTGRGVDLQPVNVALSLTSPTTTPSYGQTIVIQAAVTNAGNGTATPTGNLVFSVDGQNGKAHALGSNGTASVSLSGLSGGTHTVQASYGGDFNYASGASTVFTFTIQQATVTESETVMTDAAGPYSSAPGDAVAISFTITPSIAGVLDGTVTFTNGNTVLESVAVSPNATPKGTYGAFFSSLTLPVGVYNIVATFSGNANYAGFTTTPVQVYVAPVSYTVTQSGSTMTSTASHPGTLTLTVTSFSDFQGGVDFTCSGLPTNAYCLFLPGTATLVAAANTSPAQVPVQTVLMQILVDENPTLVKSAGLLGGLGLVSGIALCFSFRKNRSLRRMAAFCMVMTAAGIGLGSAIGCGSSATNAFPTPVGSYPITVTSTATPQPGGTEPTQYVASSISSSATTNQITLVTTNLTSIEAGNTVTIVNASPAAFNGVYTVVTALDCTTPTNCSSTTGQTNTFTFASTLGNLAGTSAYLRTGSSVNYSVTNNMTLVVQ